MYSALAYAQPSARITFECHANAFYLCANISLAILSGILSSFFSTDKSFWDGLNEHLYELAANVVGAMWKKRQVLMFLVFIVKGVLTPILWDS